MKRLLAAFLWLTTAGAADAQVGQGAAWPPVQPPPVALSAYYVAPAGNDSNPGTIGSPFATLGKCQTAMEGGSTKLCYVRGGLYSTPAATTAGCNHSGSPANIVQLTHAKGDDGETFSYYPPDGVGSAVFDGGGTIPTAFCAYHVKNVTITGLTFQHFTSAPLYVANWDADDGNGTGDAFTGNTVLNSSPGGSDPCINGAGWSENARILNNFVQNCGGQGIGVSTTQGPAPGTPGGMTGLTVSGNVVFNSCMAITDCGGIYFQDYQLPVSTGITNSNNYIYQVNAASTGGSCIYHDDGASNVASTGNVCIAGGSLTACWLIHGGSNDVLTGNICDEQDGSEILRYQQTTHTPGSFPMTGNSIVGNDVVCRNVASCGLGYRGLSPAPPAPETNHGNTYWNFDTASGAVISTGSGGANGDSSPIAANPALMCPSGFSTAWGPPGFTLPTVLPGPPPSWCSAVKGINPSGGGWLNMTSLSAPNLASVVADFQAMGLNWVRYELDAPTIDPTCGSMTWGNNDAVISALHAAGIKVMALLNEASGCMNGSGPVTQGPTTGGGRTSWSAFATAVVQRYGASGSVVAGGIQAYEVWNEPNCAVFWTPSASPANYYALVSAAYVAIKAVDPNALVVTGGLSPCATSGTTQSMQLFTANLYAAGLKGHENAIGIHPYCASPVGSAGCDNIRKMYDSSFLSGSGSTCLAANSPDSCTILSIMTEYGDGDEQIWSTEFGMGNSQQTGAANVDQTQQAADLANFYALLNSDSGTWAGPGFWYNYQDFVVAHGTGSDGRPQCTAGDDPPGNLCFGLELYSAAGVGNPKLGWTAMANSGSTTFTYNFVTGACTETPGGTCNPMSCAPSCGQSGGSTATNNAAFVAFQKEAQWHTRPAVAGWYAGGWQNSNSTGGPTSGGDGNEYADANPNNRIVLNIPAGTYQYTNNTWMMQIPNVSVVGAGGLSQATNLQNIVTDGNDVLEQALRLGTYDYMSTDYVGSFINGGYFIQNISAGATSATLSGSPANASSFYVGGWVLIASYDQQFIGYPPNFRYFDWGKVKSANASTGVITWDTPTTFAHQGLPSGFSGSSVTNPYCTSGGAACPATLTDGPSGTVGPARIIPIDTPAHPVSQNVSLSGVHFLANPNWIGGSQQSNDCVQVTGAIAAIVTDVLEDMGMCFANDKTLTVTNSQWQADEADKIIQTLQFNNDRITYFDISHAGELNYVINGGHISNTDTTIGNVFQGSNLLCEGGALLDSMLNPTSFQGPAINDGYNQFQTLNIVVNGCTFQGNGNVNNAPLNAPPILAVTMDGTTNVIQTGPNGANTRLRFPGSANIGNGELASTWGIGAGIYKNGASVPGAVVTNVSFDGTYVYVDVSGTTFANGNTAWAALWNSITVKNSIGISTGYAWGTDCNMIRYPSGQSVPNLSCSGNSGN